MKQKLTLLFLFLAAGVSMAHAIRFDWFDKENLDHTGKINYLVKNIEKEIAADEFQLTRAISRKKDITAQSLAAIKKQGNDAHFKALIIAKGEVGNLTTTLIKKFDGFGNLQTWVKNLDEIADAKLLAKLDDLDASYFEALNKDLADAAFKNAIEKNAELLEGWKVVRESIGNTTNNGFTQFAVDPKTLEKVSEMMQSGSGLRNKFPNTWEQELSDILSANKDIGCATCGSSGITRVPPMDEMLDNVEHIMQYGNKPGFNTIMTNLKSNVHNRDGIHHMITYMKNNPSEFANVIEFEFRYADDIMNKADVLVGNVKYEFKSWTPDIPNPWNSFYSGSGDSYTQMIRYFENSTNLNQVKYVFNGSKATEFQVKNAFKDLFVSKADEIFEANPELFKQFQKIGGGKIENLDDFENLLNHETFSIDHPMFNFIKCQ